MCSIVFIFMIDGKKLRHHVKKAFIITFFATFTAAKACKLNLKQEKKQIFRLVIIDGNCRKPIYW